MNTSPDWIYRTNIYEVNIRQYTAEGSFTAFAHHLPRLADMGVETLWFMPITPIAQKNKKGSLGSPYACSDYTAVNPEFGTLKDFKRLVDQAHALGMKVIIDWVANHTGWDHVWTLHHPDWFEKDEASGDFKKASGMDDIIELDFSNAEMRKAMIEAMKFWVQACDIDGFRCDLAYWVQLDFWIEAKAILSTLKPLFWLAEADFADNPDYAQVFDAAYTWHWMHKAKDFAQGHLNVYELLGVLYRYLDAPGMKAWFTSNHDENTWNGTEYEKYGYLAKALAVFSCTWPGLPIIYSGQELPNHKRLDFFDKDPISWTASTELHRFYQTLLNLRRSEPSLHAHTLLEKLATSADDKVLAYQRCLGSSCVVTIINLSPAPQHVFVHDKRFYGTFRNVFGEGSASSAGQFFHLEAGGFVLLVKD
jgi:alpha-amylase